MTRTATIIGGGVIGGDWAARAKLKLEKRAPLPK